MRTSADMLTVGLGPAWRPLFAGPCRGLGQGADAGEAVALGTGGAHVAGCRDGSPGPCTLVALITVLCVGVLLPVLASAPDAAAQPEESRSLRSSTDRATA